MDPRLCEMFPREATSNQKENSFDLSFGCVWMEIDALVAFEQALNKIFRHPDRQYAVNTLNLDQNLKSADRAAVIVKMIEKSDVYKIKKLSLADFFHPLEPEQDELDALLSVVKAGFDTEHFLGVAKKRPPVLQLANSNLRVQHFASICSSLRHGCVTEELLLANSLKYFVDQKEQEQCWRWLAFGLFYPRSNAFCGPFRLKKIDLSHLIFDTRCVEAFQRVLDNPAALACLDQEDDETGENHGAMMVCTVRRASIVYSARSRLSAPVIVVGVQRVLESIYQHSEWVCVIVPGVGTGWIEASQVVSMEPCTAEGDPDGFQYDLVLASCKSTPYSSLSLHKLIKMIGRHLTSLDLSRNGFAPGNIVTPILEHCPNLERLELENWQKSRMTNFATDELDLGVLVGALRGDLGQRLTTLNLNGSDISDSIFETVAGILSSQVHPPVLQELRIDGVRMHEKNLTHLDRVFTVNKRLVLVELREPSVSTTANIPRRTSSPHDAAVLLDRRYQDKLVRVRPLEFPLELAFLSVVMHTSFTGKPRSHLDNWMMARIFHFAGRENECTPQSCSSDRKQPPPPTSLREALQRESTRIARCQRVTRSLEKLVRVEYEPWEKPEPPLSARPKLTLCVARSFDRSFSRRPAYGKEHARDADAWLWMVRDESFPDFRADLNRNGEMTEMHMEAFFEFLTTPPAHGIGAKYAHEYEALTTNKLVPVGLLIPGSSKMATRCLERIEGVLDRVFASPTRQYEITQLGLRYKVTSAHQLQRVAQIAVKNQRVYGIPKLRLFNLSKGKASADSGGAEALRQIVVAAACDVRFSPDRRSTSSTPETPTQPRSALRALDIVDTSLELKHVMALCSAFRYGSPLETLRLKKIFKILDKSDREKCWGWLAFGIFYPRSKRLAANNRLRHVDLTQNLCGLSDVDTFAKTLRDPAGELVYHGRPSQLSQERTHVGEGKLLVCRVKKDSTFYATPTIGPEVLFQLDSERELEVLCQQQGWTCVVLPGIGFGWVSDNQVVQVMADEVVKDSDLRVELTFSTMCQQHESIAAFETLVEHVGRHLSYLSVSDSKFGRSKTLVATILKHCVNVEHLVLVDIRLSNQHLDELLEGLRGDLGGRLKSLNLRDNSFSVDIYQKFADFLANPKRIPALQELRMLKYQLNEGALAACRNVLLVNKTLRHIELMAPDLHRLDVDRAYRAAQSAYTHINEENQDELLPSSLPLRQKLAFLSTISTRAGAGGTARSALDSIMVSLIFKFAADDLRRRIFWHPPWVSDFDDEDVDDDEEDFI